MKMILHSENRDWLYYLLMGTFCLITVLIVNSFSCVKFGGADLALIIIGLICFLKCREEIKANEGYSFKLNYYAGI